MEEAIHCSWTAETFRSIKGQDTITNNERRASMTFIFFYINALRSLCYGKNIVFCTDGSTVEQLIRLSTMY